MANKAPTKLRLFSLGENPSEKGTFVLDAGDAREVMRRYLARGTDVSFDYDHSILEPAGLPKPSAGHGSLELRGDGLWAINIRWTEEARGLIEREEYRYFSPFFEHDEDGHISNLINVALTNTPALHGILPLLAAASVLGRRVVAAKPRAILSATARSTDMKPEEMAAMLEAMKPHLSAESYQKMAEELAAKCAAGGEGGDDKTSEAEGDDTTAGAEGEDKTAEAEGEDDKTAEAEGEGEGGSKTDPPPAAATEGDETAEAVASALSALRTVTGERKLDRAIGKLAAMGKTAPKVEALSKQVADLQAQIRSRDVNAKINAAQRAGKITPAMTAIEKEAREIGMVSLERLDAFLSAMPVLVHPRSGKGAKGEGAGDGKGSGGKAALSAADVAPTGAGGVTDVDIQVGKKLGLTPDKMKTGAEVSAKVRLRT